MAKPKPTDDRSLPTGASIPPPMAQRVAEVLAGEIAAGGFRPDEPLREQDLAARFGTSRGPIREAFRILERERLVEVLPWRGARVARMSDADRWHAAELREVVFALVARLAAERRTEDALDAIETAVDVMARDVAVGGATDDHVRGIVERIRTMCGNPRAADLLGQLDRETHGRDADGAPASEPLRRQVVSSWRGMIDALRARDPDTAESIARRMVRLDRAAAPSTDDDDGVSDHG